MANVAPLVPMGNSFYDENPSVNVNLYIFFVHLFFTVTTVTVEPAPNVISVATHAVVRVEISVCSVLVTGN